MSNWGIFWIFLNGDSCDSAVSVPLVALTKHNSLLLKENTTLDLRTPVSW